MVDESIFMVCVTLSQDCMSVNEMPVQECELDTMHLFSSLQSFCTISSPLFILRSDISCCMYFTCPVLFYLSICKILGFHTGVAEDSSALGCYAMLTGTFYLVCLRLFNPEGEGTTGLQIIASCLPVNTAYPRRLEGISVSFRLIF